MRARRIALAALAGALLLTPLARADGTDFNAMSDSQRKAFGEAVRGYILDHPEVIYDAVKVLEQRKADAAAKQDAEAIARHRDALMSDPASPVMGNPGGDVTIVEFLDHRCHYCKAAYPALEQLLKQDGHIRLVLKEFPILGPESVVAGKMMVAAERLDPAHYPALHDALMTFRGDLTGAIAYRLAADAGYDPTALKAAAEAPATEAEIGRDRDLADALGIDGTPGFVIGDRIVRGYLPAAEMKRQVDEVRAASN